jgi:predicted nuclease of predicted toxin-antitoxin system
MKLLIDMNLSPKWVDWFAGFEISAAYWSAIGNAMAPIQKSQHMPLRLAH